MGLLVRGAAIAVLACSGLGGVAVAAAKTPSDDMSYDGTLSYSVTRQYSSRGDSTLDSTATQRASVAWHLVWQPDPSDPSGLAFRLDTRDSRLTGTASSSATNPSDVTCSGPITGVNLQQFAFVVVMRATATERRLAIRAPVTSFTTCFGSPLSAFGAFPTASFNTARTFDVRSIRSGDLVSVDQNVPFHSDINQPASPTQAPVHDVTDGRLQARFTYRPEGYYVALGDSYASGEGLPPLEFCHRSPHAYPALVQQSLRFSAFYFEACTGATTLELNHQAHLAWQRRQLSGRTRLVTITIGGDDIGFSRLIEQCVLARIHRIIRPAVGCFEGKYGTANAARVARGLEVVRQNLPRVFSFIQEQAPDALVLVTNYPYVFPRQSSIDCSKLYLFDVPVFGHPAFNADDVPALWRVIVRLNSTIFNAVEKMHSSQFQYVDVIPPFVGHDACEPTHSWFTPIYIRGSKQAWSLHPTEAGQQALATRVEGMARTAG